MTPRCCLVTGATGAVGPRLVEALLDAGWIVRALSRGGTSMPALAATGSGGSAATAVRLVPGDVTDPDAVRAAVADVDVVFHLAALLHANDPPPAQAPMYRRVNVDGTRHVVEAARAAGVSRVVFFSTIAVYGYGQRRALDEDSDCRPDTFYGRTKLEAERVVLEARRADGRPLGTVLRLAAVYGPGVKGNYERLVRGIARGRFVAVGPGLNRRALVHDRDVAQAAILAAEHAEAAGRLYNVSDGQAHRLRDIIAAVAAAAGRPVPRAAVPLWLARLGVGVIESGARLARLRSPISLAMVDKYMEDVVVDATRIRRELGFAPRVGFAEGWRDTVEGLRAGGRLA